MAIKRYKTKRKCRWVVDCRPDGVKGKRLRVIVDGTYAEAVVVEKRLMSESSEKLEISESLFKKSGPLIYFVRHGDFGPVKIGFSRRCLSDRLNELQKGNPEPLIPIGVIFGGTIGEENKIQKRFEDIRIFGEWFKAKKPLLDFIERNSDAI